MPIVSMFSFIPPFLNEEKKDGPTCKPIQNTNRIKPNSRMKCKMCVSPVNPKCPIRIPVKSTNETPNDTPKILILPSSTPTDITNAYRQTICATDEVSQRRLSNQIKIPYYNVAFLNFVLLSVIPNILHICFLLAALSSHNNTTLLPLLSIY